MKHELQKMPKLRLQGNFYPFGAFFDFLSGSFRHLIFDRLHSPQMYKLGIRVKNMPEPWVTVKGK
jgi:hypothetical protein